MAQKNAKRFISSAKEKKQKECTNDLNDSVSKWNFSKAKQMVKERQVITGLNCIKGESGKVIVDDLAFGFSFYDIFMPSSIL